MLETIDFYNLICRLNFSSSKYRNNKNGNIYTVLSVITDATNGNDEELKVLYVNTHGELFCRTKSEFEVKFIRMEEDTVEIKEFI